MHRSSSIKQWRNYDLRYRVMLSVCDRCKKEFYPNVHFCDKCAGIEFNRKEYKGDFSLVTWSRIYANSTGFDNMPELILGIIQMDNGNMFSAQIVDTKEEHLSVGKLLHPTFRRLTESGDRGIIQYGLKFY